MNEDPFAHITDEELMREISRREKAKVSRQDRANHTFPKNEESEEICAACGLKSGALFWTRHDDWRHVKCPR